jgi:microcystin-dependent protein
MSGLEIPLPTASPSDDPAQYIPLLLSAIEGFLLMPDVWQAADYPEARNRMQQLIEYVALLFGSMPVSSMPVGSVLQFMVATAPDNWLVCDGAAVSRSTYAALFAVLGTVYGLGDNSTTFNLPDMRGRSPMGKDGTYLNLAEQKGSLTHTLALAETPVHDHAPSQGGVFLVNTGTGTKIHQPFAGSQGLAVAKTEAKGGGGSHANVHPVLGVQFIIYAGVPA